MFTRVLFPTRQYELISTRTQRFSHYRVLPVHSDTLPAQGEGRGGTDTPPPIEIHFVHQDGTYAINWFLANPLQALQRRKGGPVQKPNIPHHSMYRYTRPSNDILSTNECYITRWTGHLAPMLHI